MLLRHEAMVVGVTPLATGSVSSGATEPAAPPADAVTSAAFSEHVMRAMAGRPAHQTVPLRATRLSGEQASAALSSAWQKVMHQTPSKATVSILVAQWAHETGRGKAMMNYNFGGIKGAGPSGMTASSRTVEGEGANAKSIIDNFRAYATPEEGATDYVSLLKNHYPDAVAAANNGDPAAFVQGLKKSGYFTGSEADYTHSVAALANEAYQKGFGSIGASSPYVPSDGGAIPSAIGNFGAGGSFGSHPYGDSLVAASFASAHVSTSALVDHLAYAALQIGDSPSRTARDDAEASALSLRR